MNRTLAAFLVALAVIAGCSTGPVVGSPAAASPSLANEPQATTPSATPSPTPAATATPFPYSDEPVAVEAGTYRIPSSAWSVADFTMTLPDGWMVQYGHRYADSNEDVSFYAVVVDAIYADACKGSNGELMEVGRSVHDLADALLQQPGPEANGPIDTTSAAIRRFGSTSRSRRAPIWRPATRLSAFRFGSAHLRTSTYCLRPMKSRARTSSTWTVSARCS